MNWRKVEQMEARNFICGYCGQGVGPDRGYHPEGPRGQHRIFICTYCRRPTYLEPDGSQFPGVPYGAEVEFLPEGVRRVYDEACRAMSVNAFTVAAMACRKVLMNVAVEEGAKENESFAAYVNWLADEGFVPAKGRSWVDRIRENGNEANHEIPDIDRTDAEDVLSFTEMLLKVNYEMPARAAGPPDAAASPGA
jgi:Domain of unknown function (DUF4145)